MADLYHAEGSGLYRSALIATQRDIHAANDLVQMVFQATAEQWAEVEQMTAERRRKWLYTVLRNKHIDSLRAQRRVELDPEHLEQHFRDVDSDNDTADIVIGNISDAELWNQLKELSPRQYQVVYLLCKWGCTTGDVAKILGISAATVRVHLSEAAKKLRSSGSFEHPRIKPVGGSR